MVGCCVNDSVESSSMGILKSDAKYSVAGSPSIS